MKTFKKLAALSILACTLSFPSFAGDMPIGGAVPLPTPEPTPNNAQQPTNPIQGYSDPLAIIAVELLNDLGAIIP
jgi:hypothetical protein